MGKLLDQDVGDWLDRWIELHREYFSHTAVCSEDGEAVSPRSGRADRREAPDVVGMGAAEPGAPA